MAVNNKEASNQLSRIRKDIEQAYIYFKDNAKRYRDFRRYVFKESVNDQQKSVLQQLSRPIIEVNILEAYISRLLGEFSKHEPSIEVMPSEGVPVHQNVIDLVEMHIRHIFHQANKDSFSYEVYKDLLSGGYSVAQVYTDYASRMSFEQQIFLKRVYDPTMVGFDPLAHAPHKGDGKFCFEVYPMIQEDFAKMWPDASLPSVSYQKDIEGFHWSYKDAYNQKIVLVCDYYEKKKKKTRIVKLANGRVMTARDYEKLKAYWHEQQFIEQIPKDISYRWTEMERIVRYRLVENEVLEYEETDYSYLPYVFIDGHSIVLTQGTDNVVYQMTRPYVYHAKGIQDLKNFAAQTLANYLENQVQHKFIVMKEAIPQERDYLEALNDIQRANTIVVNAYSENNPDKPIGTPIREVVNQPAPPEVMGAFQVTDPTTQVVLGSFASNLGKNDNDLSGKAVIESASVGNAAAMPYVVGYLQGLTQIGNIIVDLMPKYLVGKRKIGVTSKAGEKDYREINTDYTNKLDYEEQAIRVNVDAGVNFQVQKNQAVEQIIALMHSNESLQAFFNDEDGGLSILVRNLTIYGADELPEAVERWSEKKAQMQQQAQQMQQQAAMQNPQMIRAQAEVQKVQQQGQQQQIENQFEAARLGIEKIKADAEIMQSEAKISQSQIDSAVRLEESETSRIDHNLDAATKLAEIKSRESRDHLDAHKTIHEMKLAESKHNLEIEKNRTSHENMPD